MSADEERIAGEFDLLQQAKVEDLYTRYAECICDDELERWPDFFTEECVYQIMPRANRDRGLPISIMLSESKGGLIDRMTAIRNTMVFAPRSVLVAMSGIRIVEASERVLTTRSSFTVYQTIGEGLTNTLMVGRSFDQISTEGPNWKFTKRVAVYDSAILPETVIYPV